MGKICELPIVRQNFPTYGIGSLMATIGSDNKLNLDLGGILTQFSDPSFNIAMLNNMGIYFDQSSVYVAYDQCMNPTGSGDLRGSITIFNCYT